MRDAGVWWTGEMTACMPPIPIGVFPPVDALHCLWRSLAGTGSLSLREGNTPMHCSRPRGIATPHRRTGNYITVLEWGRGRGGRWGGWGGGRVEQTEYKQFSNGLMNFNAILCEMRDQLVLHIKLILRHLYHWHIQYMFYIFILRLRHNYHCLLTFSIWSSYYIKITS